MRRSSPPPPLWFSLCVAVALACALRWFVAGAGGPDVPPGHAPPVQQAFLEFLVALIGLIWKGIQVAGKITLEALHWIVINLSLVVTKIGNGLKALGGDLLKGLKRGWDFFRRVYDDVLKPAWAKFWGWFDKFRRWLDDTFKPILKWLKEVRDAYLCFYKTYIRPWLDLIDVTRKLLRALAALHVPFARELDRRLGKLEDLIERPFRLVLAKINEIINIVNRVVTLDGLLQRVALIRSLARDYQYAWRAIVQPYSRAVSPEDKQKFLEALAGQMIAAGFPAAIAVALIRVGVTPKPAPTITADLRSYLRTRGGVHAPLLDEMTIVWRKQLQAAGQ